MLDLRRAVVPAGAALGLALAAMIFLLFAGHAPSIARLDDLDARLAAARAERPQLAPTSTALSHLIASPLFNLTTGPGAVADIPVALTGVAMAPRRIAALIAVGNGPAQWLTIGASRDGVALVEVQANKVVVDTPTGFKEIRLWDQTPAQSQPQATTAAPQPAAAAAAVPAPPADPPVVSH